MFLVVLLGLAIVMILCRIAKVKPSMFGAVKEVTEVITGML